MHRMWKGTRVLLNAGMEKRNDTNMPTTAPDTL